MDGSNAVLAGADSVGHRSGTLYACRRQPSVACWICSCWACLVSAAVPQRDYGGIARALLSASTCCAMVAQLREPFDGAIECDETTFGGARKGKRGWGALGKV